MKLKCYFRRSDKANPEDLWAGVWLIIVNS